MVNGNVATLDHTTCSLDRSVDPLVDTALMAVAWIVLEQANGVARNPAERTPRKRFCRVTPLPIGLGMKQIIAKGEFVPIAISLTQLGNNVEPCGVQYLVAVQH